MDTNVFIALFSGEEEGSQAAQHALEQAAARGTLVVSPVVHGELLAGERSAEAVDEFFSLKAIEVDWELGEEVWRTAGARYGCYARDRRRQATDPGPRRILADFLVGSHALRSGGGSLLSTDARIFSRYFPELEVLYP